MTTGQDTSLGKTGQSSDGKGGTTSKDKGKLYTAAQITKIESDAAAKAGRLQKAAEVERDTFKKELESTNSRLDSLEREVNESRLAEARGDPEQLRIYNREQAVVKRERQAGDKERDLASREEQLKSDLETLATDKGVVNIAYIAAKHGLETEDLEDLGISDPEALEKVAEKLAAVKTKGEGEDADRQAYQALETDAERAAFIEAHPDFEPEGAEGLTPDTLETTGGAGALATLAKANEDFQAGKITEKQLQEISSKVK